MTNLCGANHASIRRRARSSLLVKICLAPRERRWHSRWNTHLIKGDRMQESASAARACCRKSGNTTRICRLKPLLADVRRGGAILAFSVSTVSCRSVNLAAFALLVAVVAAASSTLIVQAAQSEVCVMTPPDCADTAKVADCCCHADDASQQGGPIESRAQLTVTLAHHPVELAAGALADTAVARLHIHTSPASIFLPDLATRFAPLLV